MGTTNGIITETKISISDVAKTLGAATSDLGTLCKHENVNMWSRRKPVSCPHPMYNGKSGSTFNETWIGDEPTVKPYGISIPQSILFSTTIVTTNLGYKKPTGTANAPYRLGDFRGYNHNCVIPYRIELVEGEHAENETHLLCLLDRFTEDVQLPTNNLTFNDIYPTASHYFCIAVQKGTEFSFKTIPNTTPTINIGDCPLFKAGNTITLYACMVKNQISSWSSSIGDNNVVYSVSAPNIVTKSEVTVKAPWANSYKAVCEFSDGSHILSAKGSVTMSNGKINASFTYVSPETIRKTYDLTSVTLEAKDLNDNKTYTKPSTANPGAISFTEIYVGRLDIQERPSGTVSLSCTHHTIVGDGHYGDYVYTFHFTARSTSGGGANI